MISRPIDTTEQLLCLQKGGPFEIKRMPLSTLGSDQVLIRQRAIGLNGLDYKQRDWGLHISQWPHVLGVEGAGVIEAIGSDVKTLRVGDEVYAWEAGMAHGASWGGAYQEYVVMPACYVAKKPKDSSFEEAAALPICYNTAICAFYLLGLKKAIPGFRGASITEENAPKSILILGGSSVVGAHATQLLRLAYPSLPILTTSSPAHHAHLLSLGATEAFDYHSTKIVSDIKAASPEKRGVDIILDCVGAGKAQSDIFDALDPAGPKKYRAVVTGPPMKAPDGVDFMECGGETLTEMPDKELVFPTLTELIDQGKYRVPLTVKVVGHGLDQIPGVMDQVKTVSGAKLIVTL